MLRDVDLIELANHPYRSGERRYGAAADYLRAVQPPPPVVAVAPSGPAGHASIGETIFNILTSREFCYLSRTRVEPYRATAVSNFERAIRAALPVGFHYDLGGGYHASLDPRREPLDFNVGLGEWLVIGQLARLWQRISAHCASRARFAIVIDNLCALAVNDIPLEATETYCRRLRKLISQTGWGAYIDVLVESERFNVEDYLRAVASEPDDCAPNGVSEALHRNIERFLGRPCEPDEALRRAATYLRASRVTARQLSNCIDGVHMTQRAGIETPCLRPFPGGDSRIQTGRVALLVDKPDAVKAVLLTSTNVGRYKRAKVEFTELLPAAVGAVTLVRSIESSEE